MLGGDSGIHRFPTYAEAADFTDPVTGTVETKKIDISVKNRHFRVNSRYFGVKIRSFGV